MGHGFVSFTGWISQEATKLKKRSFKGNTRSIFFFSFLLQVYMMEKVRIFKGHDIIDDMWDFYFLNRLYFGYWEHKHSRIIGTLGKRRKKKRTVILKLVWNSLGLVCKNV